MTIEYLQSALELAAAGFKVFPVWSARADGTCACGHPHDGSPAYDGARYTLGPKDTGKHPACQRGHKDATDNPSSVRSLWSSPDYAVAVSCEASGLLVVDIDPRNGGIEAFRALEAICPMPATTAVRTGGGGVHLYYRHPGGKFPPNLAKLGFPGVDLKTRGYVVAPPSLHASGARYAWHDRSPPASLPDAFINLSRSSVQLEGESPEYDGGTPATPELLEDAWQRLVRHGPSVQGQNGDDHCYQVGSILLTDYDLQWDDAVDLAKRWNEYFPENHWSEDKLKTKLRNAAAYSTGARGIARVDLELDQMLEDLGVTLPFESAPFEVDGSGGDQSVFPDDQSVLPIRPPNPSSEVDFLQLILQAARDIKAYRLGLNERGDNKPTPLFQSALDLLSKEFPTTSWLVQGLLTDDAVAALSGEPKSTKSWCAQEISIAIATNTPAFGKFDTGPPQPVAIFLTEDAERNTRNRLRAMAVGRGMDPAEALQRVYVSCRQPLNLSDDSDLARLIASCRVLPEKPALIVLDPMRNLHGGDEDSSKEMAEFMGRLRALRDILGASVLFVHHSAKNSQDVSRRRSGQKMRGSGAIHGAIDCGFYVQVDADASDHKCNWTTSVEVEIKAARGAGVFKLDLHVVDRDDEAEKATWKVRSVGEDDPAKAAADKDVQTMRDWFLKQPDYTSTYTRAADQGPLSRNRASRAVETMKTQGWLKDVFRGMSKVGYALDPAIVAQRKAEIAMEAEKERGAEVDPA